MHNLTPDLQDDFHWDPWTLDRTWNDIYLFGEALVHGFIIVCVPLSLSSFGPAVPL